MVKSSLKIAPENHFANPATNSQKNPQALNQCEEKNMGWHEAKAHQSAFEMDAIIRPNLIK